MVYTAGSLRRLFAFGVDAFIVTLFTSLTTVFEWPAYLLGGQQLLTWLQFLSIVGIALLYHTGFLMALSATPGKALVGLRVVDASTLRSVSGLQALTRGLGEFLCFFFSWLPVSFALFSSERRTLVDWLAGTRVVQHDPRWSPVQVRPVLGLLAVLLTGSSALRGLREKSLQYQLSPSGIHIRSQAIDEGWDLFSEEDPI